MFLLSVCPSACFLSRRIQQNLVCVKVMFCASHRRTWGCGGIPPVILLLVLDEVNGQHHFFVALPPGIKPHDTVLIELRRPQGQTGSLKKGKKPVGRRERNQQDATNLMFFIKLLAQHVSGIIMPIFRRTRLCTTAYGFLHWLCWPWLCGAGTRAVCTV